MRVVLVLVVLLAGCVSAFEEDLRGAVVRVTVRLDDREGPGTDDVRDEAVEVLEKVFNVHRRGISRADCDSVGDGTGNVRLHFAPGTRFVFPAYPEGGEKEADHATIVLEARGLLDGNVLLCAGEGGGEYSSSDALDDLGGAARRALDAR